MNEEISQLRMLQNQIKRLQNAKLPDETKSLLAQCLSIQLTPAFTTPILNDQSPFVLLFSKVNSSQHLSKQASLLNMTMLDAMVSAAFGGAALVSIEKTFELFVLSAEPDICIRLLQVNANLVIKNCDNLGIVSSVFSISLKLVTHKVEVVSTTAFALTQQMSSTLFEHAMTNPVKTERPVSWLLLRDFANAVLKQPLTFLRVKNIPRVVDLWEMIIATNSKFIGSQPPLMDLVAETIVPPLSASNLPYILSCVCCYTPSANRVEQRMLSSVLGNPVSDFAMVFLRCAFFRRTDLAVHLDADLVSRIIEVMDEVCDGRQKGLIDLSMVPKQPAAMLDVKDKNAQDTATAVELAIVFMAFCVSQHKLGAVLSKSWQNLLNVLVKAIRLVHPMYAEVVFTAYAQMLAFVEIDDARSVMVRILCSVVAKQKLIREKLHPVEVLANTLLHSNKDGFGFKKKRAVAYQTLISLLYSHTALFSKFYTRLFLSLGMYPNAKLDPLFTTKMDVEQLVRLCEVLSKGTTFCVAFLRDVILANQDKFATIWPAVKPAVLPMFKSAETKDAALELLMDVTSTCFDETEIGVILAVLELATRAEKQQLLYQVKSIMLLNSNRIERSWEDMLSAISPANCDNDPELLSLAFNCLHMICSGHFQRLSEAEMQKCISVIFEFAFQTADINMSLSALGLLWDITPFIHQLSRFWKRILSETLVFFNDSRTDVATCALKTFFSLLTSNTVQMPADIYDHLIVSCFIPLLMTFTTFKPESWPVQQLALLLICHCACSFWDQFYQNPQFIPNFWTLLIEKQQSFLMNCENQEINSAALQFYEESFTCQKIGEQLKEDLLVSFATVVAFFFSMSEPKTLVLSSIGQFFFNVLPRQKDSLTKAHLGIWLDSIRLICSKVTASTRLTLTAQKGLEAACMLFPLTHELARQVVDMYVDVLKETPNEILRTAGFQYLTKVFSFEVARDNFVEFVVACKPLFQMREAAPLVKVILGFEFHVSSANSKVVFDVLNAIGQSQTATVSSEAHHKILDVLPMISPESQRSFLASVCDDLDLLFSVWNRYCEKGAQLFNMSFTNSCGTVLLEYIFRHLASSDENRVLAVLMFVQTSNCYERTIGTNKACCKWHLYPVLPHLFPLLNSDTQTVLKAARVTLLTLETELKQMIVE